LPMQTQQEHKLLAHRVVASNVTRARTYFLRTDLWRFVVGRHDGRDIEAACRTAAGVAVA